MNPISLISIEHITQLIPALAALKFNQKKNKSLYPIMVLTKPHLPLNELKIKHLQSLLQDTNPCLGSVENCGLSAESMKQEDKYTLVNGNTLFKYPHLMTYIPARLRAQFLYKKFLNYSVKEIYFAHDVSSDFWNQALMQAFPQAKRICYGDALGLVYTQKYFTQLMYGISNQSKFLLSNLLARIKRNLIYPSRKKQCLPHEAILAIPCDPGGDFLKDCKLSIIHPTDFKQGVAELAAKLPDFKNHLADWLLNNPGKSHLLMLNNFTESKMTTLENEILLYQNILNEYVKPQDNLIIKPHPAQRSDNLQQIVNALASKYRVKVIDPQFFHLPIELAEWLIKNCNILSLSYSSISLSYIYDKKVNHVLTPKLINKYFLTEKLSWFIESNDLYINMIKALQSWNSTHELFIEH